MVFVPIFNMILTPTLLIINLTKNPLFKGETASLKSFDSHETVKVCGESHSDEMLLGFVALSDTARYFRCKFHRTTVLKLFGSIIQ